MLTPAQQSALDYHLRETNLLTNEELILELTDHYTTSLDEYMGRGISFETALTSVQTNFGGRKGLQKMERQYNRVTFLHYDERWWHAVVVQFQKPLLLRQTLPFYAFILLLSFILIMPGPMAGPKWARFCDGMLPGLATGLVIATMAMLLPYIKSTFQHGFHNIPTETLYLLKRQSSFTVTIFSTGIVGYFWLMPLLPSPIQAILVSVFLASLSLYVLTSHQMHELLYEYEPSR